MNTEFSLNQMVKQQIRTWDVLDQRVLQVMTEIPRNRFVPLEYQSVAFADYSIPLTPQRAMLTPKLVGRILQALELSPSDSVLEVGTGSGYLTACLATLAGRVLSIDTQSDLLTRAAQIAEDLGLNNVKFEQCSDTIPEGERRFDVIVVTGSVAQMDHRYEHLLENNGRLFITVGEPPIMDARLITRINIDQFLTESLFETSIPALKGASPDEAFEF